MHNSLDQKLPTGVNDWRKVPKSDYCSDNTFYFTDIYYGMGKNLRKDAEKPKTERTRIIVTETRALFPILIYKCPRLKSNFFFK